MDKSKKTTYIIAAVSLIIIIVAIYFLFVFQKGTKEIESDESSSFVENVEKIDIDKRPYVTLTPVINSPEIKVTIENMSYFDKIEYELTYLADNPQVAGEKIQRGSVEVDVNTTQPKYSKQLLLGTASRGARSPDTGITDGKLALHLFKGDTEYLSETHWDRFEIGTSGTEIIDHSGNFSIDVPRVGKDQFVIIAETVGVPPNPPFDVKKATLPVYGAFAAPLNFTTSATLTIKVSANNPKLYSYSHNDSKWAEVKSDFKDGSVNTKVDSFATFVIVSQE